MINENNVKDILQEYGLSKARKLKDVLKFKALHILSDTLVAKKAKVSRRTVYSHLKNWRHLPEGKKRIVLFYFFGKEDEKEGS